MTIKEFKYQDGTTSELRFFEGSNIDQRHCFLILPGLGIWAKYYDQIAQSICDEGYDVYAADWRGLGSSSVRASRVVDFGYEDLIQDTYEIVQHILKQDKKIIILGHSMGAQLGCLLSARYALRVDKLVLVATINGYYKGWSSLRRYGTYLVGLLFYPLSKIFGYLPGKRIGFGDREAMGVIKDWSRNIITGNYVIDHSHFYYDEALKNLDKETLAISFEGDHYAPKKGLINLYSKFRNTQEVKHIHLNPEMTDQIKLNHFNWVRHPKYIVNQITTWLEEISTKQT